MHCGASIRKKFCYGSMEWNMEESFSMEWKIISMEWKKLPKWNMEKSSSIPYQVLIQNPTNPSMFIS